ncbi:glycoside hydrolase family 31 protein [Rhizosphaericola mali]|uniref:Glycoside hydrolase n=1 Tax=Rhizosphaericola mali TaxID=2545455 RepID=A0A5P2G8Q7_9BACT|nr:glycoside hydrolase family 31 protein [Rhizosphaericola mali]QES90689.1 glycoside hydrolase [Rhizosphaericola mali]
MIKNTIWTIIFILTFLNSYGQSFKKIKIEPGEHWYGLTVRDGDKVPYESGYKLDLNANVLDNQAQPLLLSSKGRYIWNDNPFACTFEKDTIVFSKFTTPFYIGKFGNTLKDAYLNASKQWFPFKGKMPDSLLFKAPQYNTWIELVYNQNQKDILKYAHSIIDNGFEPGVLMIDDNWAPYYGRFEFRKDRFPDAKMMIDELHQLGFKIMVWVSPFIRPDCEESRYLTEKRWIMMDGEGKNLLWKDAHKPFIASWWNGYSMVLDLSQKDAVDWYQNNLHSLVETYHLDGFKFDAGDPEFYLGSVAKNNISANLNIQTQLWGNIGLQFSLNEYRSNWKHGGEPLAERLRDKGHNWKDLLKLIPDMTNASLLGYPFACPDMIGGGEYGSFLNLKNYDQDLVVRSAQCSSLMPMMQFSVAPWRILDSTHLDAIKKSLLLRKKFTSYIINLAKKAAQTGEPIVSNLEYKFPNQGFEKCNNQFMLGDDILVAPVVTKNNKRLVYFPKGYWMDQNNKLISGPKVLSFDVAIDELLWFRKVDNKK